MYKTNYPGEGNRNEAMDLLYGLIVQRSVNSQSVTVGNTPTKIPTTPLRYRKSLWIMNIGANPVYIGNASVSVANGFPIYPRAVVNIQIEDGIDVYGIVSGSEECRILEGA